MNTLSAAFQCLVCMAGLQDAHLCPKCSKFFCKGNIRSSFTLLTFQNASFVGSVVTDSVLIADALSTR